MIKNYLTIAFRNLWKHRTYTFINILGLAIGMACVMLITLFVQSELSVDKFHANKDSIYRLNIQVTNPRTGETRERAIGPYRLASEMEVEFPDLTMTRFTVRGRELIDIGDVQYTEEQIAFVDPNVFEVFTYPLIEGDPATALEDPFSVVISESAAEKYFGTSQAMGRIMQFRDQDWVVNGIMEDVPENSELRFNMFASLNSADQIFSRIVLENWGEGSSWTFAMTSANEKPADFEERLQAFVDVKLEEWSEASPKLIMQPLPDLYLHSKDISTGVPGGGDIVYVYAFSFIAIFILIIACINYMNLATARSSMRSREVGLRKVVGATKNQLVGQFLSESTILALVSLVIGGALAAVALPYFNQLADKQMTTAALFDPSMLVWLFVITAFVGVVAGSYPAFVLSGFQPINALAGLASKGMKGGAMRKVLVSFQFATSIFLLVITAVVYKQLGYCRDMNLGFNKEHIVLIQGTPMELRTKYDQFRTELLSNPQIINGAASSRVPPGNLSSSLTARPEGVPEDQQRGMQTVWTDFDFVETIGLELATGRSFSREYTADASEGFLINEAAVKEIGWTNESAIDKRFGSSEIKDWDAGQWEQRDGKVIGVIKDFYFESLKEEIVPTVYFVAPYMAWNYVVRIRPERVNESIAHIEKTWEKFVTETPFEYTFVDENYAELYSAEERQGRIFGIFAGLAIFIACLGLVGLASFTAERKKKEVGIRKVLGASSFNLIMQLSREFTLLVIVAFIIASPIAWYVMDGWLQDFAYRTPLGVTVFLLAGIVAIAIAWVTVGLQTFRTAYSNPVEALRYE